MLTKEDLNKIGEELGRVVEDNLLPQLDQMIDEKLDKKLDEKLAPLTMRVSKIEAAMVTKHYLDDKLADLRGEFFQKFKQA